MCFLISPASYVPLLLLLPAHAMPLIAGADGARCQHSRLRLAGGHGQARLHPNRLWGLQCLLAGIGAVDSAGGLGLGDLRAVPRGGVGGYQVEDGQERGMCPTYHYWYSCKQLPRGSFSPTATRRYVTECI